MKLLKQLTIAFCLSCLLLVNAHFSVLADELFPDLSGADLQLKIAEEYTPDQTLGYRKGRDVQGEGEVLTPPRKREGGQGVLFSVSSPCRPVPKKVTLN